MKVFSVFGITGSGKTTTVENIIKELVKRRYKTDSVKDIHFDAFKIDTEGSNTDRHYKAGAGTVTARGHYETDILFKRKLSMEEIYRFYDSDYLVCEGVTDSNIPKIICAHNTKEADERLDSSVFAFSGRLSNEMTEYKGLPVINAVKEPERLVNLIEELVPEKLPDFPAECCNACGFGSCSELLAKILKKEAKREDCVIVNKIIRLRIDGKEIEMVPFVQKILLNSVLSTVKELDGYRKNGRIEIEI
ncbi:MAG TPA: molybdopterin-guanine dinucleotide biosynthesis protein MobB [Clostridiales bacterium]|nr:molybdopterin-guanine dinucleotide biosynthesis protein MobB [Clostridiales bacterium]HQP69173.1 molybdopterin-guanine dinucleotide biosynthesis protein MobB [Clostridiales bacterium]